MELRTQHNTQTGLLTESNAFPQDELEPKHQGQVPVTKVKYIILSVPAYILLTLTAVSATRMCTFH